MPWAGGQGSRTAPLPPDWPARRQAQLQRDGCRCTELACTTPTDRLQVDHVEGVANHAVLRTLCHGHHAEHTAQQAARVRWQYRDRRQAERHPGLL